MNLYYKIWVDGLQKLRSIPTNRKYWKVYAMTFISMAMAINFMVMVAILERNIFRTSFYNLNIGVFPGTKLNSFSSFFILFLAPCVLINYLLIFWKNKYEILFEKYKVTFNGKLCASYIMISYFSPFILLIIGYFVNRL